MITTIKRTVELWKNRYRYELPQDIESRLSRLETLSHGGRATYVGNNRVLNKVVTAGMNFAYLVEANDLLISPWFIITGAYEISLTDYFLKNVTRDDHCLDVGSNFGFFTCLLSRLASNGMVLAIEPDRHVFELCRDNIMINGLQHVASAIHAAANSTGEELVLHRRVGRSGNTSVVCADESFTEMLGEPPAEAFTCAGLRIDDLLPRLKGKLDFMKIDVEGAEPDAFRGAQKTIATNPQLKIVMEWSPGQIASNGGSPSDFLDELSGQGLTFFNIDSGVVMSKSDVLNTDYAAGLVMYKR
ncbi:MAG: FkbM family methyltransferase [Sphingomonas sp.]|uniref:FkbM family methyltransferase n=1 Tax=Sphingomonas sp. TaxID=28214 RepID=UPI0035A87342|nr:FkbM family methyltransferase [Sphingomonas sp.]